MHLLIFFAILLLLLIAYPLVKIFLFARKVRKGIRKVKEDVNKQYEQQHADSSSKHGNTKVFSDEGVDVEYERVDGPRKQIESPTRVEVEEQVTDVEYEKV